MTTAEQPLISKSARDDSLHYGPARICVRHARMPDQAPALRVEVGPSVMVFPLDAAERLATTMMDYVVDARAELEK